MHLYIITRGIKHDIDKFITEMQGKYLKTKHNLWKTSHPKQDIVVQVAMRPIQLFEVVFPEDNKDIVLNTILGAEDGKTQHKKHDKYIWALRKALGVKPIPKYNKTDALPVYKANTEIIGIGIKEDYYTDDMTGERYYNATPEQKAKSSEGL